MGGGVGVGVAVGTGVGVLVGEGGWEQAMARGRIRAAAMVVKM